MDIKSYIESGILELYVAGQLSEKENQEVAALIEQHPELLAEVEAIETAILQLSSSLSSNGKAFNAIKDQIQDDGKVVQLRSKSYNWITYSGWAASLVLAGALLWTINTKDQLQDDLQTADIEKSYLEQQIEAAKNDLAATKNLLDVLRDREIISVPLGGQANFETTYAKVYWDKNDNTIYLDAQGLPEVPEGKVYQVWSLTLNPLTPTSLGTIDNFNTDDNKIFTIANANESQAFGITLEPEGGSESPTMEQLHTLGIVASVP